MITSFPLKQTIQKYYQIEDLQFSNEDINILYNFFLKKFPTYAQNQNFSEASIFTFGIAKILEPNWNHTIRNKILDNYENNLHPEYKNKILALRDKKLLSTGHYYHKKYQDPTFLPQEDISTLKEKMKVDKENYQTNLTESIIYHFTQQNSDIITSIEKTLTEYESDYHLPKVKTRKSQLIA